MLEWMIYLIFIVFFIVLMVTGWIKYAFIGFMVYLAICFIAEAIKLYQAYKSSYPRGDDK
ncbi:hypothetical protein PRCB_02225 [Pantoea rodasii]|uniref:Uncharacterized protein n=1 Tax=Pantoea rodasii TaxID=1076549 RepID=A0A2M9WJ38_9GAMM|nr:hypothetical protein HA45_11095 [Pantoea rodasii]PJZ07496.1 hypothetical protein PRCB_02225 [Pantoea rodasii]